MRLPVFVREGVVNVAVVVSHGAVPPCVLVRGHIAAGQVPMQLRVLARYRAMPVAVAPVQLAVDASVATGCRW